MPVGHCSGFSPYLFNISEVLTRSVTDLHILPPPLLSSSWLEGIFGFIDKAVEHGQSGSIIGAVAAAGLPLEFH